MTRDHARQLVELERNLLEASIKRTEPQRGVNVHAGEVRSNKMNLSWFSLTNSQRNALHNLCQHGPCDLPRELGEQLTNLGLAEPLTRGGYCVSPLGMTIPPATMQ